MKFRKIAEWEEHDREPGGDEVFLLEAVDVPQDGPRYALVSWSVLTEEEFDALERGEVIDLKDPHERLTVVSTAYVRTQFTRV